MKPAPYRPQEHAAAVADLNAMMAYVVKEIAVISANQDRILALHQRVKAEPDGTLDKLICAIREAFGRLTWTAAELFSRAQHPDQAGLDLSQAIQRTGKTTVKALGTYLSTEVPEGFVYTAPNGLELARSGKDGNVLAWHINGDNGV